MSDFAHMDYIWAEMPILLALSRFRTLEAAAEQLNVNRTTISRRLKGFEEKLGVKLFVRADGTYNLTAIGRELLVAAETAEASLTSAEQLLFRGDANSGGPIRITMPPHIAPFTAKMFTDMVRKRPEYTFDIVATYKLEEIEAREADIALRILRKPPDYPLSGQMLRTLRGAVYESCAYDRTDAVHVMRHGEVPVSPDMKQALGGISTVHTDDIWAKQELIAAGGIGRLPIFMGDNDARLKRASDILPDAGWRLWMITHEVFKTSPRLKAIMDDIAQYFSELDAR
ncbi:LysR family transcriptional regulator [Kordiimonas aquimaris]|uniref:LysR family transcriptional regulator n=1 Tax=Kordiimonas aquimaris TaxID=707591 RepID=UPI0021CEDFEA|nr:LysR family transcriptional regulator [Kordiimonas aquimaris]